MAYNMTGKQKIVFKIDMADPTKIEMEAVGFNGQGCKEATKPFENALGGVVDRTMKPSAWTNTAETTAQHITGGTK